MPYDQNEIHLLLSKLLNLGALSPQERGDIFIDQILLPMLSDRKINDVEYKALNAFVRIFGLEEVAFSVREKIRALFLPRSVPMQPLSKSQFFTSFIGCLSLAQHMTRDEFFAVIMWFEQLAERHPFAPFVTAEGANLAEFQWLLNQLRRHEIAIEEEEREEDELEPEEAVTDHYAPLEPPALVADAKSPEFWEGVRARTERLIAESITEMSLFESPGYFWKSIGMQAFIDKGRHYSHRVHRVSEAQLDGSDVWFVGDIHGDLLGLEAAISYVKEHSTSWYIVFLGDYIDRGPYSLQVMMRIVRLFEEHPGRVCALGGNHDVSLTKDADGHFSSLVFPADFTEWLNAKAPGDPRLGVVAENLVSFFKYAPVGLVFPDGLLAVHGGIPHKDLWPLLLDDEALMADGVISDMVWTRASESSPRKRPNRSSRGCQFGFKDFFDFATIAREQLGMPIDRMVRGHDHVNQEHRYAVYSRWGNRALTLNNMCMRLADEMPLTGERNVRCGALGRYIPGEMPEVHLLLIPEQLRESHYGAPAPAVSPEPPPDPELV